MSGSWFEQLQAQVTSQVTAQLEQGAVALGILSADDVGDGSDLSGDALVRRFGKEACSLKEWRQRSGSSGLSTCTNPEIADGPGGGPMGPPQSAIDQTFQQWLLRLQSEESGESALACLLKSQALNIVLPSLASSRSGRAALQAASDASTHRPLRAVLIRISAVPSGLLGRLLQLVVEAADVQADARETGMLSDDSQVADEGLQWVLQLLSASLLDASEADLPLRSSVDSVQVALATLAGPPAPSSPEHDLDAAELYGRTYNDMKAVCEVFLKPTPEVPRSNAAEKTLDASANSLSTVAVASRRIQSLKSAKVKKMLVCVAESHQELAAVLSQRVQTAKLVKVVIPELAKQKVGIASACLEAERVRSRYLEEAHAQLTSALWGPESEALWQDGRTIPMLRTLTNRMSGLVDQAWREMVQLAAETLDDNNALSANSEDISAAATRYKDMRAEVNKYASRLAKMEQATGSSGKAAAGGGSLAFSSDAADVPAPKPAELAASAKRKDAIAALRGVVEKAAASVGVTLPPPPVAAAAARKAPSAQGAQAPVPGERSGFPAPPMQQPSASAQAKATAAPRPVAVASKSSEKDVKAEIAKYAGAVACFKRYEKVPVRELWERNHTAGFSFWKDKSSEALLEETDLAEVAKQARTALYAAVGSGVSPESLTCGLGRAMTRFQLVEQFQPLVVPTVSEFLQQLAKQGIAEEPTAGANKEYQEDCEENAMITAVLELQKSKVIPSSFKYVAQPSAHVLELLRAEVTKYTVAVAYFRRYEKVPVRELWEGALKEGLSYWKDTVCSERSLQAVVKQARESFDDAIASGITPKSLASGLGRALMRFLLLDKFKAHVSQMVAEAKLAGSGAVQAEGTSNSDYHAACEAEVIAGVIAALQESELVPRSFQWNPEDEAKRAADEQQRRERVEEQTTLQRADLERQAAERRRTQKEAEISAMRAKASGSAATTESCSKEPQLPAKPAETQQQREDQSIRARLRYSLSSALCSGELQTALATVQGADASSLADLAASVSGLEASVSALISTPEAAIAEDGTRSGKLVLSYGVEGNLNLAYSAA